MELKPLFTRIISLFLIFFGLYQILLSTKAIFFVYPYLSPTDLGFSSIIQEGLIEKALLLYATMIIDGIYGITLLLKPIKEVEIIHLILGILIGIASVISITKTPFTTDPIFNFLRSLLL